MKTPHELAEEIRTYGYWQGPDEQLDELVRRAEEGREIMFAAIRLCNVHGWSYGGPETLRALADRIAQR